MRQLQSDRDRAAKGRLLLLRVDRINPQLMGELAEFVALPNFDIGVLSTSETSLREMVQRNEFHKGLGMHLSTLEICLPRLSERLQDLPLLCQAIVEDFNAEGNRQISGLHADALELLYQYPWPGNVEELGQIVHAACQVANESQIRAADLPKIIQQGVAAVRFARPPEPNIDLPSFLKEIENELMRRATQIAKGNKTKAARLLGISRQRMIRWSEQQVKNKPADAP
jgi:DNA-binding NtrC family response regulator